ncbi:sugar transport protein-related [Anaeramoeba flamelloides]|uniref:Sugar transport protein-related n=1 Tax=Anaeramoeba flamelloides TaxID=1746091 RepID=A0AAV7Z248_9EUKA|nr:sugar transport protein-related [Anaeramoeba flamelloides]
MSKSSETESTEKQKLINKKKDDDIVITGVITTYLAGRLDRLPFSKFHLLVITALGISWILDGLEVMIIGAIGTILARKDVLGLTDVEIGLIGTTYLIGAVLGSLVFGWLSDRYGRKKIFMTCPIFYLTASVCMAFSMNFTWLIMFNILMGFGIGGEYSGVNSAVNEFIPSRIRGRINIIVNGSYWLGATLGSIASLFLLNSAKVSPNLGWRFFFGIGSTLGIVILFLRSKIPESPRWLVTHNQPEKAEEIVLKIEQWVYKGKAIPELIDAKPLKISQTNKPISYKRVAKIFFEKFRKRSILGLILMLSQAFMYNALFFTYALVLKRFYDVREEKLGYYLLGFCVSNFIGPLVLSPLFDIVGRKIMISLTYFLSSILLLLSSLLFLEKKLSPVTQTVCWGAIFFVASPGASAAYLTISEIFPLEIRSLAISFFYALGTGIAGTIGPVLFSKLISTHKRSNLFYGYLIAVCLMFIGSIVEIFFGVKSEGKGLEEVAKPLADIFTVKEFAKEEKENKNESLVSDHSNENDNFSINSMNDDYEQNKTSGTETSDVDSQKQKGLLSSTSSD